MEAELLAAARKGDKVKALSILKVEPLLFQTARDEAGNTVLHIATRAGKDEFVKSIVRYVKDSCLTPSEQALFVGGVNASGQTALDISVTLKRRKISWTLIQCGGSGSLSGASLLEAVPEDRQGNTFLHVYARNNYAKEIKEYVSCCSGADEFFRQALTTNQFGDLPATTAAKHGHKDALLALLQPFMVWFPTSSQLSRLLHHENNDGQRLLAYVANHEGSLAAAHGILIEMEAEAHNHDSYSVKSCFRTSMGSTMSARFSVDVFERIKGHRGGSNRTQHSLTFLRILGTIFFLRTFFFLLDIFTDVLILKDYYNQWKAESSTNAIVAFPGKLSPPTDPCKELLVLGNGSIISSHVVSVSNLTLHCYAGAISGLDRLVATGSIMTLPWVLYAFEVLRFRPFSAWLDRNFSYSSFAKNLVKLFGNFMLWMVWPVAAFFRHFLFQYRFETSEGEARVRSHRNRCRRAALIGSRAQLIEVCTEASLQPLLQFYLVFQEVINLELPTRAFRSLSQGIDFILDAHSRQVASVIISLLTLAASYTARYRHNKESSLATIPTAVYFASVSSLVVARILSFEMFAYYMGPGRLKMAMGAVGAHALVMAALHFAFSDSLAQCLQASQRNCGKLRQRLLVVHNCLLNGLANLYVHNHLEIFVQSSKGNNKNVNYVTSDVRRRTLTRQLIFDAIFLAENAAMLYVAKDTMTRTSNFSHLHHSVVIVAAATHVAGLVLKITFYVACHPWAELIRPQRQELNEITSCVVFSRHLDVVLDVSTCQVQINANKESDRRRYESINLLLPTNKIPERKQPSVPIVVQPQSMDPEGEMVNTECSTSRLHCSLNPSPQPATGV